MKAMIFAAGRGERMRPLTDTTPKPLVMLRGEPLIVHVILACKRAGITEIIINVCYQAQSIMSALGDGSVWGVRIQYSQESEPPLETAGGIIKALPLLGFEPFLVHSCDVWTNYDLSDLFVRQNNLKLAHLVMVKNPDYHPQGDFGLLPDGRLSLKMEDRLTYASFGLYDPRLFQDLPVQRLGLGKIFRDNMDLLTGELFEGEWFNIGTVADLAQAENNLKEVST